MHKCGAHYVIVIVFNFLALPVHKSKAKQARVKSNTKKKPTYKGKKVKSVLHSQYTKYRIKSDWRKWLWAGWSRAICSRRLGRLEPEWGANLVHASSTTTMRLESHLCCAVCIAMFHRTATTMSLHYCIALLNCCDPNSIQSTDRADDCKRRIKSLNWTRAQVIPSFNLALDIELGHAMSSSIAACVFNRVWSSLFVAFMNEFWTATSAERRRTLYKKLYAALAFQATRDHPRLFLQ